MDISHSSPQSQVGHAHPGGAGVGHAHPGGAGPDPVRLTLITRAGCHLCDVAKEAIERVSGQAGVGWTEVDVSGSRELERDYGDRVPVILLDGREHGYWRVEEERLLRDLGH